MGTKLKLIPRPGVLSTWRYETSFNQWIGGKAHAFREFTADLCEVAPGESVLDLGCGTGALTMSLARRVGPGGRVSGVDISKERVAGARRKANRAGLTIDYRVASIERLPFSDGSVDLVVSSLVFHHLAPEVLGRAVGEIQRVLKPGGRVFIIDMQSVDQAGHGHHRPTHRGDAPSDHPPPSELPIRIHNHSLSLGHGGFGPPHRHSGDNHVYPHPHPQAHGARHGVLHDHRPILVRCLQEVGLANVYSIPVKFGQPLEVTRGRRPL